MTQVNHVIVEGSLFASSDGSITKNPSVEDFWRLETIRINDLPDFMLNGHGNAIAWIYLRI